ncbi:MAG TPA: homoserine kinase [Vicinamibacterales bacterium]|nr:homoserine kinase [Vicinamibacterales bacterium]
MHEHEEIAVPGSVSNLGPGFDALSVAIDLHVRVRILALNSDAPDTIRTMFADAPHPGDNRIEIGFRRARAWFGRSVPGVCIEAASDVPMKAGLGSSAAATVAGLLLYGSLAGPCDTADLLRLACELEGHPDNASAALLGGLTVSCVCEDGRVIARASAWPETIQFVVATPGSMLETARSRVALAAQIPLPDAVFNLQRALLLLQVLESGDFGHLGEALRDRWHQPARSALVPCLAEALAIEHPAVLGVCLSGAGSSVVALARAERTREAAAALSAVYERLQVPHTIRILRAQPPVRARALQHTT